MILREYQTEAISSIYSYYDRGGVAPLVVCPTGSGKSIILASLIREICAKNPATRILVLTHVRELVDQDAQQILGFWPDAPMGIYSAGMNRRDMKQITVASIQSVYKRETFWGSFDMIVIDEAHLVPPSESGMYSSFLINSAKVNPATRILGLTATPYRLKSGLLHEGAGAIFDGISYEVNVRDLIEEGFLCRLTCKHGADVDLSKVRKTAGEFNLGDLGATMAAMDLIDSHCDAIVERCANRNAILVFAVTVAHAEAVCAALEARGIASGVVTGDTPAKLRDQIVGDFKAGRLRALINCMVLTTGFDYPGIDAVVILRPTLSPGLYVQMTGRGLRMSPGKIDCLVVDFGGNVMRHGFIDNVRAPTKKGSGIAPVKLCPLCHGLIPLGAMICPQCEHVFPAQKKDRQSNSYVYEGPMLSEDADSMVLLVSKVAYRRHVSKAGFPTLCVTYYGGILSVREYICIEHEGFPRERARKWWMSRDEFQQNIPDSVSEAVISSRNLMKPHSIVVNFSGKYPRILSHHF